MTTDVYLSVNDTDASVNIHGKITAGSVGIKVYVDIAGERWEGIAPMFVASCRDVAKENVIIDGVTTLPTECLISGERLFIGVKGVNEDNSILIPTIFVDCKEVYPSVMDVDPENASTPTPDIVDQILYLAHTAEANAKSVVDKVESGELDGKDYILTEDDMDTIAGMVKTVKKINDIPVDADGNITINAQDVGALPSTTDIPVVYDWAKQAEKPTYTAQEVGAMPADTFIPQDLSSRVDKLEEAFTLLINSANDLIGG